jgi:hypothetical protein
MKLYNSTRQNRMNEPLLNGKELAKALRRSPCYVTAMRNAGYVFKHESLGMTTLSHALEALDRWEHFNADNYLKPGRERRPKCLAAPIPSERTHI